MKKMDLVSGYKGVVGLVFGNEDSSSNEDSYVERLLDCINNGKVVDDRRNAMAELQAVVADSHSAQLAFGTMGFPVLFGVLKEREDVELVRGAVETLLSALTPISHAKLHKNEVQPALMNADLLSRDEQNISHLLNLLSEDDFYVRYYTLQLLTALLTNSHVRLQEVILTIPRGMTQLVDMLMDREAIRNEALLLLTYLTREAAEVQKILVFEGAFEKIFSIINEEGGSDGGVVVQVLLRETIGFDSLISILKLRGSTNKFAQQKTVNLLCVLETIRLLLNGDPEADSAKYNDNKTVLVQRNVLDHLLMLGVESQWAPVAVRCAAFRCIGNLLYGHRQNRDTLSRKFLGDELQQEPALNSILRIILRTSSKQEFIAADYVFKCFCEQYSDGQKMLASTLIPQPLSMNHAPFEEDVNMSFGSMLLHGLTLSEHDVDLETTCRAASVLSYVLKDNIHCKDKVLKIELESPTPSLGSSEPLLHRMVKYLALASSNKGKDIKSSSPKNIYVQPIILKLLVTWLSDCPNAVHSFLNSAPHLTFLIDLVSNVGATVCVRCLAAVLLGECVIFNKSIESGKDAYTIVDSISQKIGLPSYFLRLDEMQKSFGFSSSKPVQSNKPFTKMGLEDNYDDVASDDKNEDRPMLVEMFDSQFVNFIKNLENGIRDGIVKIYSRPKNNVSVIRAELEQMKDEPDANYIQRLRSFLGEQCSEIDDLVNRNATLAGDLANAGGGGSSNGEPRPNGGSEKVQIEKLKRDLLEASQQIEILKTEKSKVETEASSYKELSVKIESDLKSLSDAYNSIEQMNYNLENEVKALKNGGSTLSLDLDAIKAEAKENAQKESEAELGDLLVCLGQEQSKVEKLSVRLMELGEDVDALLEGIGDDIGAPEEDDDDEGEK
ncbi:golgin candidate 6-like isoform X2 [Rutidosis leptorrhynchoides]|uniref:golgin candidate 6-like isoform X2 n=1 Tax=Rutidosis leptorrhynchoides TaxID=125765 RepID=UPI003A99A7E0